MVAVGSITGSLLASMRSSVDVRSLYRLVLVFGAVMSSIALFLGEVVFMAHKDDTVEAILMAHQYMTARYANMSVPAASSLAVGLDFSCPVEVGDEFGADEVRKAVDGLLGDEHAAAD